VAQCAGKKNCTRLVLIFGLVVLVFCKHLLFKGFKVCSLTIGTKHTWNGAGYVSCITHTHKHKHIFQIKLLFIRIPHHAIAFFPWVEWRRLHQLHLDWWLSFRFSDEEYTKFMIWRLFYSSLKPQFASNQVSSGAQSLPFVWCCQGTCDFPTLLFCVVQDDSLTSCRVWTSRKPTHIYIYRYMHSNTHTAAHMHAHMHAHRAQPNILVWTHIRSSLH